MPSAPPVKRDTAYFVFDIESVSDGALVSRLRYPEEKLSPAAAIARWRAELMAEQGKDFIPYTFQLPVSLVIARVAADYRLIDLVALDEEKSRPPEIARLFWEGWRKYGRPCLVTFNGRGFDVPLLELCAFRYGLPIPDWYAEDKRNFDQPLARIRCAGKMPIACVIKLPGTHSCKTGLRIDHECISYSSQGIPQTFVKTSHKRCLSTL